MDILNAYVWSVITFLIVSMNARSKINIQLNSQVKFLWESYCQCLELLRTNAHVETLYHDIARMAFQFCLKYSRKTEFRKLCDKLRKHLEDICKPTVSILKDF